LNPQPRDRKSEALTMSTKCFQLLQTRRRRSTSTCVEARH